MIYLQSSSKYNMVYFTIPDLENKLGKTNLSKGLRLITNRRLEAALKECIPNAAGKELTFYKDRYISNETSENNVLFKGVFAVAADRKLKEDEMSLLSTEYLKCNPQIDNSIIVTNNTSLRDTAINSVVDEKVEVNSKNNTVSNIDEDLNAEASMLDESTRIFGVVDDINHLKYLEKIQGIDIIKNIGDFKKTYFSIPSPRQEEVLAHSVTILKSIKCKRALLDYINN